jgi:AcrR family transcriptional regulator
LHVGESDKALVTLQAVWQDYCVATPRAYAGIAGDQRQADRRRRLIDAALDLLAEGGPAAITVTGVCRQAGLTARYFYEHFANRDALLEAIVDAEADLIIAVTLAATVAAEGGVQARGEAGVRALLDALDADPRAVRISRERRDDEVVLRMRAAITQRLTAAFVEHAALMWPDVAARPERVFLASSLTIGGVLALVTDWLDGDTDLSRDELIRVAAQFTVATGAVVLSA